MPTQTNTTLINEGVPPSPDVAATHLARALIPLLLGEADFLHNQLNKMLVFSSVPGMGRGSMFLSHLDGRQRGVWVDG
jgi:hypothetical protein